MAQAKKPTMKAFVGTTAKKTSKKGLSLTKRTALFGLVGIMAFSVVGGWGWQKWQEHQMNIRANAAGWTTVGWDGSSVYLRACLANGVFREYVSNYSNYALTFNGVKVPAHSNSSYQTFYAGQTGWIKGPQRSPWGWVAGGIPAVVAC